MMNTLNTENPIEKPFRKTGDPVDLTSESPLHPRRKSRRIMVGPVPVGGGAPISVQRWNLGLIKHRDFGHMELCGLLRQQLDMCSARRQTGDGKSFRMTRDDVKSLGADGSGGSENDDSGVGGYAHCSFFVSSLFSVGNDRSGISESKLPPSGNSSGNESLESCLSCDG